MRTIITVLVVLWVTSAEATVKVVDVDLASRVERREPIDSFEPPVSCLKKRPSETEMTVINSNMHRKVFFWTKIASSESLTILHRYYKDRQNEQGENNSFDIKRTTYSTVDGALHFIGTMVDVTASWLANVQMKVAPSPGYRTWSSKQIWESVHKGIWKVEAVPRNDGNNVLCTVYFKVE